MGGVTVDKTREAPESIRFRNTVKQQGWAQVYHVLTLDTELSDGAYRLYALLLKYARQSGGCWPGVKTLARDLGRSPSTIKARLDELVRRGLIIRERRLGTSSITWIEDLETIYGRPENRTFEQPGNRTSEQPEIQPTAGRKTGRHEEQTGRNMQQGADDDPSSAQSTIESLLTDFGVDSVVATRLARNCSVEFVRAWVDHTQSISHKLSSPQAFLVSRLKLGKPPPPQSTNTGESVQGRRRTGQGQSSITYRGDCGRTLPSGTLCPAEGQYPECRGCEGADSEESPQDDGSFQETPPAEDPDATNAQREKARQTIKHLENNLSADRPAHHEAVPPC
jgi:GntR family transcriptional regulator